MDNNEKEQTFLNRQNAIDKWREGKDVWNQWVEANPEADISFHRKDLSQFQDEGVISFQNFMFPIGFVDFSGVTFGEGDVNLSGATFGKGNVDFSGATFGKGNVDFSEVTFGEGDVNFSEVTFGEGDVNFSRATFGKGNVDFSGATFGKGNVSFMGATFGKGNVDFSGATFGKGNVSFMGVDFGDGYVGFNGASFGDGYVGFMIASFGNGNVNFVEATFGDGTVELGVDFGKGDVNFSGVTFGKGFVRFSGAKFEGNVNFNRAVFEGRHMGFLEADFGKGNVDFSDTSFGEANVDFSQVHFGEGKYIFERTHFKGNANFSNINSKNDNCVKQFSFRSSTFEKSLDLSGNKFNCVVDLTNTKITNQVSLEGLKCKYIPVGLLRSAKDEKDIERPRRLKDIAETNKDHALALSLHANEMRAKRMHEIKLFSGLVLDLFFDILSDYGQSIGRPAITLIVVTLIFGFVYQSSISERDELTHIETFDDSLIFSASQVLPFVPIARSARSQGINKLFNGADNISACLYFWMFVQGLISFVLLFLLGLGIRNRFRL